eukprot:TRINITY_DN33480_c0_g1_i1.p1 TRINITY_DN33480_c0_g1~~TRINITY_DN33480_c0_g1_i1.p1  ORF type:complete len:211 (+),score=54.14 TRINITY_DN33480_c0_g1_i1:38-670(+)
MVVGDMLRCARRVARRLHGQRRSVVAGPGAAAFNKKVGRNHNQKIVQNLELEGLHDSADRERQRASIQNDLNSGSRLTTLEVLSWREILHSDYLFYLLGCALFVNVFLITCGRFFEIRHKRREAVDLQKKQIVYEGSSEHMDAKVFRELMDVDRLADDPMSKLGNSVAGARGDMIELEMAFRGTQADIKGVRGTVPQKDRDYVPYTKEGF